MRAESPLRKGPIRGEAWGGPSDCGGKRLARLLTFGQQKLPRSYNHIYESCDAPFARRAAEAFNPLAQGESPPCDRAVPCRAERAAAAR